MLNTFRIISAFLFIILIASCNQDPSSIGSNLISGTDKIAFKEFDSQILSLRQSSKFFENNIKLGTSEMLLLGKNDYAESNMLLVYDIFLADSLQTYLKNNELKITDAWMTMNSYYTLGEKTAPFNFTVHHIRSSWSPGGFNKDSLKLLQFDNTNLASNVSLTDTTVQYNLNKSAVLEWLQTRYINTANRNYGILLKPSLDTKRFYGFPAYLISSDTDQPLLHVVFQKPNLDKDTISVTASADMHVVKGTLPTQQNRIYAQGGLTIKSSLFFDISNLPKDIVINKATLDLTFDENLSVDGTPSSDSLMAQVLGDSINNKLNSDSSYSAILTKDGNIYRGDVTWMVQKWASGTSNQGFLLSLYDEYTSAARLAFYSSKDPNKLLRPRLKIVYTQRQ